MARGIGSIAAGVLGALALAAPAQAASGFQAGAASADITPPPYTQASDAAFVPACGTSAAQVAQLWRGSIQVP